MEEYSFKPIDVVIHWYTRFRSWLVSKRDNRILYKQFASDFHLEKMEKEDVGFILPDSYLIETSEIKQLYNVRDEILVKLHDKEYVDKQSSIDKRIKELEKEHESLKSYRVIEKNDYSKLSTKLNKIKNSEDYIALESRVSQAYSKLKNTEALIENCENNVASLIKLKKTNYTNWDKQIELVEKTIDDSIVKYINRSTKKIGLHYGFTKFKYKVANYDDKLKSIINGEY